MNHQSDESEDNEKNALRNNDYKPNNDQMNRLNIENSKVS